VFVVYEPGDKELEHEAKFIKKIGGVWEFEFDIYGALTESIGGAAAVETALGLLKLADCE